MVLFNGKGEIFQLKDAAAGDQTEVPGQFGEAVQGLGDLFTPELEGLQALQNR